MHISYLINFIHFSIVLYYILFCLFVYDLINKGGERKGKYYYIKLGIKNRRYFVRYYLGKFIRVLNREMASEAERERHF